MENRKLFSFFMKLWCKYLRIYSLSYKIYSGGYVEKTIEFLTKKVKLKDGDAIVAGISGGPDSMALLHILMRIRKNKNIKIICAHVNHNVRKESVDEAKFLEEYCKNKDIVFESMVIEKYNDDNFHNEARSIRYKFFNSLIDKYSASYLMTAHHGDDLIETILMRLTRGSTLKGYSGFSKVVEYDKYRLVRPLIYYTKEEIEKYDSRYHIPYVIDSSNDKDKYTRNRYRKTILPFLKEEDSNVHLKYLKFSESLEECFNFIDKKVKKNLKEVYANSKLDVVKYSVLDPLIQKQILYTMLEEFYQDDLILINDKHVELMKKLILSNKKNGYIYLPNDIRFIREYDKAYLSLETDSIDSYDIEIDTYAYLPNKHHLEVVEEEQSNSNFVCRLSSSEVVLPLHVRTRKLGDVMEVKGLGGKKKVKDIFIDEKISAKERELWPVVVDSTDKIVWLPGLKKSKFDVVKKEKCDIIIKYY